MTQAWLLRRAVLVAAAVVAALATASLSAADIVRTETVEGSSVVTIAAGATGTAGWRVVPEGGQDVCDAETVPAVVTLLPPAQLSLSTTLLTFTACRRTQSVSITVAADAAPGDYVIGVTAPGYDTSSAAVTVRVPAPPVPPPPDTTPPVLSLPGDVTAEATGPGGAAVTYAVTASDNSGSATVSCTPPSGSTFPLGSTAVACTAKDVAGNESAGSFTITIRDTTPPVLTVPGAVGGVAETSDGAAVTYAATAVDVVDGAVAVSCSPPSGTIFAVGVTTVNCSAQDSRGNVASASFAVTVSNSAPVLSVPGTQTAEAAGPTGARVNFTPPPSATDPQDGPIAPLCSEASGSLFPLGTTTVTCTATDKNNQSSTATFDVVVADTTPPLLLAPPNIVVVSAEPAASSHPQIASFLAAPFVDDLVGGVSLTNDAPNIFPLGSTTVTFVATDGSGNRATASAIVEVRAPAPGAPPSAAPRVSPVEPPGNVVNVRVRPLDRGVSLEWQRAARAIRYVVERRTREGVREIVCDGPARVCVDRGLVNGVEYRYVVVSYDASERRSVGVSVVAVPAVPTLLSPAHGAAVTKPPVLKWRRVGGASYYNLQLFRVVTRQDAVPTQQKILTVWPTATQYALKPTWRMNGRTYRLAAGTYEWYLWAGTGPRRAERYSGLLGWNRFTVRPRVASSRAP